jgi:RNA polymerase sigma-70 factor (ECF subfamily)
MPGGESKDAPRSETLSLIQEVRAGDRARLNDLYRRVAPSIYAWASLRLKGAAGRHLEPDDLVQEVWLRALLSFSSFDPESGSFRRWVYGIVHNVMREVLRAVNRLAPERGDADRDRSSILDVEGLPDEVTSLTERMARDQAIRSFMERVEALDAADRDLVSLRGLEGLPFKDVARLLRVNEATARKRWERLRTKLAADGPPDGIFGDPA